MTTRSGRQVFNFFKKFDNEAQLDNYLIGLASNIVKSHSSNCTCCRNTEEHPMRVKYRLCTSSDCHNSEKTCFKILICEKYQQFSLYAAENHTPPTTDQTMPNNNEILSDTHVTSTTQQQSTPDTPNLASTSPENLNLVDSLPILPSETLNLPSSDWEFVNNISIMSTTTGRRGN